MKKSICVILLVAFMVVCCPGLADVVIIDAAHFPDAAFRELVAEYDKNHDGTLQNNELATVTDLYMILEIEKVN